VPFYSKNKEGITLVEKREEGIRSRAHETRGSQDPVNGETVAQSMAERRGSDSIVELKDIRNNQRSSPTYSHTEVSYYIKKLLTITK
jgi:hypothetical protein